MLEKAVIQVPLEPIIKRHLRLRPVHLVRPPQHRPRLHQRRIIRRQIHVNNPITVIGNIKRLVGVHITSIRLVSMLRRRPHEPPHWQPVQKQLIPIMLRNPSRQPIRLCLRKRLLADGSHRRGTSKRELQLRVDKVVPLQHRAQARPLGLWPLRRRTTEGQRVVRVRLCESNESRIE
jgi:hypothetical protein